MRKYNLIVTLLFGLVLISCNNDNESESIFEPQPEKHYTLVGEWTWLSSSGGYGGDSYTPENTGNTLSLTFVRNGNAYVMENLDTVLVTEYYRCKEELYPNIYFEVLYFNCDSIFATPGGYFIIAPDVFNRFVISYLTDTLYIYEADISDGYGHAFKRKTY